MTDLLNIKQALISAIEAALAGDWETSHNIVQVYSDPFANWIHAVLHKIEGDESNSKYWYARTHGKQYESYGDGFAELVEIADDLHYPDKA